MDFENQEFDAIVVGTGPGGAAVARELSKRNKKVLILEWGPGGPVTGSFRNYFMEQMMPGKSMLMTGQFLGIARGITTGGSSLFYYGTAFPVPHKMLQKYGIDVTKEEKEVRNEVPIAPLEDKMMTPMAKRIMESARELGHDWNKLDKFLYHEKWKPEYKFGYYGDPHGVKWSSRMWVMEAVENGAVLLNKAKVIKAIIENNVAIGVEFKMKGKRHKAFAPKIVISAGGIGSAVILRACGIKEAGYNFFYDPLITVCGKVNDVKKQINEIPMSAGCHMEEEGYVMTDMAIPATLDKLFAAQVLKFPRLFETGKTLRIMIKAKDGLSGKLTDSGGVRKALLKEDKEKLMKGYKRAKEILENAGAKGVYKTWYLAAHPGGTVKIGELVDSNLKTKFENLYVCDCSVIPEPWGLPPTLTLLCLSKRLAGHLLGENEWSAKKGKKASAK